MFVKMHRVKSGGVEHRYASQPDASAPEALRFTYETRLQALPTMAVVLGTGPNWVTDPQWGIDFTRLLHGEQMLTVHRPLPPSGTVVATETIEEIFDKGSEKGAVMYVKRLLRDTNGELLVEVRSSAFLRGNGGFGGNTTGAPTPPAIPTVAFRCCVPARGMTVIDNGRFDFI
jgi:hypothetical protein